MCSITSLRRGIRAPPAKLYDPSFQAKISKRGHLGAFGYAPPEPRGSNRFYPFLAIWWWVNVDRPIRIGSKPLYQRRLHAQNGPVSLSQVPLFAVAWSAGISLRRFDHLYRFICETNRSATGGRKTRGFRDRVTALRRADVQLRQSSVADAAKMLQSPLRFGLKDTPPDKTLMLSAASVLGPPRSI